MSEKDIDNHDIKSNRVCKNQLLFLFIGFGVPNASALLTSVMQRAEQVMTNIAANVA